MSKVVITGEMIDKAGAAEFLLMLARRAARKQMLEMEKNSAMLIEKNEEGQLQLAK